MDDVGWLMVRFTPQSFPCPQIMQGPWWKRLGPTKSNLNGFLIFELSHEIHHEERIGEKVNGPSAAANRWMSTATHGSLLLSRVLRVPVPDFYGSSANNGWAADFWVLSPWKIETWWNMSLKNVLKASLWSEMMMSIFFPWVNWRWCQLWCTLSCCIIS